MLDYKYEKDYGNIRFGELSSKSSFDYEDSIMKYLTPVEDQGFISNFGRCKIGEIDNIMMKEFEAGFKSYFS